MMLDSNLITKQIYDLGSPVPDTVKGAVTLVGGLIVIVGLLNGAVAIPACFAIIMFVTYTWRNEISIDFEHRTYTQRQGPFGFRVGTKKSFGTPEFIAIREKALRDGGQFVLMKSASSRSMTIALLAFEESDNMLLIMQNSNASNIMEQANAIALYYDIPLTDERS